MKKPPQIFSVIAILLTLVITGYSQASDTNIITPDSSSALYQKLLDAVRPSVESKMNAQVKFDVLTMNVKDDWSFLVLQAKYLDGKAIDFMKSAFETPTSEMPNTRTLVLLRKVKDRWFVIRQQTGQLYGLWTDEAAYFVDNFDLFRTKEFAN